MKVSEFDFDLPAERIAQRPLTRRDGSRMLLLERTSGRWEDRQFREFPDLLRGDELIVLNNARVLPARMFGRRAGLRAQVLGRNNPAQREFLQSRIEVFLIRQIAPDTWETLVRPGRKIHIGERIVFGEGNIEVGDELEAVVEA